MSTRGECAAVPVSVLNSFISGAAAGALAKGTVAPLDLAKINFQVAANVKFTWPGALQFMRNSYQVGGVQALWRGNSATMARIVPSGAIYFTAFEQWKRALRVDADGSDTKAKRFLAGSLTGATSQMLTYPLDVARARMAVASNSNSLRQVFARICAEEGARALYRGCGATLVGVIPYAGTSFFTYETLKREYRKLQDTADSSPSILTTLAFGAIAGATSQTASYPFDTVRRRLQTSRVVGNDVTPNAFRLFATIYRNEGLRNGLYKGLSMNWIKGPISTAISFATYDFIKGLLATKVASFGESGGS